MIAYHLFFSNLDGRVVGAAARVLPSDETALDVAKRLLPEHPIVEVWRGQEFVGRLATEQADRVERALKLCVC